MHIFFFFQAEDGIRDVAVTGVQTCALPISAYLNQNDIQNFIFYGPAGTGKTTLAKIIVNSLEIGRASCRERV